MASITLWQVMVAAHTGRDRGPQGDAGRVGFAASG